MSRSQRFTSIYTSERTRLGRLINRIVGNANTADDLVHDTFSNFIDRSNHQSIDDPSAYLTRAARNLALNYLRHMRHGVERTIDEEVYKAVADNKPSPEMDVLYRQVLRRLLKALSSLPDRRREVFILHRFENMTYGEIATKLDLSKRTVINHVFNALEDLNDLLGSEFLKAA